MLALRPFLELLAPARNADIGLEAVNHGADAVYIGGPGFGARASAGNSVADIERLCRHAHRYGARIFVTLNTILRDDELEPARRMAWDVYQAGADALIVQDMALLEMARAGELPPIQLHASTQTDIRTPEKARFLQDAGFAQIVLARELTLEQIQAVEAALRVGLPDGVEPATLEFFIHGALCVAYSGQCYISHAHTGRSANRGDCSQACRLPYTVTDPQGRIVAHDQHVLSLKDNNQSANLAALVDAGVRSFKIEGRYKDMGYVKNLTAHYRQLFDALLETRPDLHPASDGRCTYTFTPDPERNFNRGATDYFVNGRQIDIGAFDTPKHAGRPVGWVTRVHKPFTERLQAGRGPVDLLLDEGVEALNNNDALTYVDQQGELVGLPIDTAECLDATQRLWRVVPKDPLASYPDLRRDARISRNRDMAWDRLLDRPSAERRIPVWLELGDAPGGLRLTAFDAHGHTGEAMLALALEPARDPARGEAQLQQQLGKLGATIFQAEHVRIATARPWFVPAGVLNQLRRNAIEALEAARDAAWPKLAPRAPVEPPVPYPDDVLSYLANVYNQRAHDFYRRHGVRVVEAAYESHEATGEVSLMITRHCVRWSLSLCPKQAKGVIGVQGTVKAEPLTMVNGKEKLTLRFDCKACEMHVVGRIKPGVLQRPPLPEHGVPVQFYRTRPARVPT